MRGRAAQARIQPRSALHAFGLGLVLTYSCSARRAEDGIRLRTRAAVRTKSSSARAPGSTHHRLRGVRLRRCQERQRLTAVTAPQVAEILVGQLTGGVIELDLV